MGDHQGAGTQEANHGDEKELTRTDFRAIGYARRECLRVYRTNTEDRVKWPKVCRQNGLTPASSNQSWTFSRSTLCSSAMAIGGGAQRVRAKAVDVDAHYAAIPGQYLVDAVRCDGPVAAARCCCRRRPAVQLCCHRGSALRGRRR